MVETQTGGRAKYRCPFCGKVLVCQFDMQLDSLKNKTVEERSCKKVLFFHTFVVIWEYFSLFFSWIRKHIHTFQEKYEDADLWIFFGFSILFIVCIICCLYLFAQITKLVINGQSWLFHFYLNIIHSSS